ncbi:hypothetical protein ACJJTC_012644 [Scirpophaga incertulas]
MDEEYNETELEDRLYAMLHHIDETKFNDDKIVENNGGTILDNAPRSTLRRYWKTNTDQNSVYKKINKPKDQNTSLETMKEPNISNQKPKEEKYDAPVKTIEIIDHSKDNKVVLETSDEDEVVEVTLPPKPTITIESSDEDEVCIITDQKTITTKNKKSKQVVENTTSNRGRDVSASPVPSVVSSVSDDFIRSDCIALKISSKTPDNHSFDFSLHGSDLLEHGTPSKKMKKKKKAKDLATPTTELSTPEKPIDSCFATPKGKSKKKLKNKSYEVSEKCVPNADVYDSDSNQSAIETNTEQKADASKQTPPISIMLQSKISQEAVVNNINTPPIVEHTKDVTNNKPEQETIDLDDCVVDLTENDEATPTITENIVIVNVTGYSKPDYEPEAISTSSISKYTSTKVPEILNEDLDFNNQNKVYCMNRLRSDMVQFYNDSWGGEDFNHWELLKSMPRDADLWEIDPRDRRSYRMSRKKATCTYCNRPGHREENCWSKPKICHMCGTEGHTETRCPLRMCLNCGEPNHMYTNVCRNCISWPRTTCAQCGLRGHPATHCPDRWRCYHNTIGPGPIVENNYRKDPSELYCSGCAIRGHLVHECNSLPFTELYIASPYVVNYHAVYPPGMVPHHLQYPQHPPYPQHQEYPQNEDYPQHPRDRKRGYPSKKVVLNIDEASQVTNENCQRNNSKDNKVPTTTEQEAAEQEVDPLSSNRDNQGRIIQDNEVSDTSGVDTTARIYVTNEVIEKLKTDEGAIWLKEVTGKCGVIVEFERAFLNIKGKVADQEVFHEELRDWMKSTDKKPDEAVSGDQKKPEYHDIPRKKETVLRILKTSLAALDDDLGDPMVLHQELIYLQTKHQDLRKQKVVNPQQLNTNREEINRVTKKLNMILIGKAGLADGSNHVKELHDMLDKLTNCKYNKLGKVIRGMIGQHYHPIFSSNPRSDYPELLNTYVTPKKIVQKNKNKKKRNAAKKNATANPDTNNEIAVNDSKKRKGSKPPAEIKKLVTIIEQLKSYLSKILKSRPTINAMKLTRDVLLVKMKKQINSLHLHAKLTPTVVNKNRKILQKVESFLNTVY